MNPRAIFLTTALISAALHTQPWAQTPTPENAQAVTTDLVVSTSCCKLIGASQKLALPVKRKEISIDEASLAFDFGDGAQPFVLIELARFTKPYSINIADLPQRSGNSASQNYTQLALHVQTLDESFSPKRSYAYTSMKKRGLGYEKTVFINSQNAEERYLLVRGVMNVPPSEMTISSQDIVFVGTGFFLGGQDKKLYLQSASKGVVAVEVSGLGEK